MAKTRKLEFNQNPGGLNKAFSALQVEGLPAGPTHPPEAIKAPAKVKLGRVVLRKETAHRGGKTVIVAYDFATHLPLSLLEDLGRRLKAACGTGGTVRERKVEIQGDQAAKVR